jgi:hypothetical protein
MKLSYLIRFGCLILVAGCATPRGFNRGKLSEALSPQSIVTEEEIQRVLELKPQLPKPFKLGVYFKQPATNDWMGSWQWLPEDKELFLDLGKTLAAQGIVSETVFVSSATNSRSMVPGAPDEELKSIRLAAARHGVDAVLLVSGVSDIDRYNNALGPTYAVLVTAFFVPGTVLDVLFVSHAGLWDVRNGYLYTSVEADGTGSQTRPAFFAHEEVVTHSAKTEALNKLKDATAQHIQAIAAHD